MVHIRTATDAIGFHITPQNAEVSFVYLHIYEIGPTKQKHWLAERISYNKERDLFSVLGSKGLPMFLMV